MARVKIMEMVEMVEIKVFSSEVPQACRINGDCWHSRIDAAMNAWLRTHLPV
jgi:hypothetical protein